MLGAAVASSVGWVDWIALWHWLRPRAGLVLLFAIAVGLLVTALFRGLRRAPRDRQAPALSWWVVAGAGLVVAGVAWGATAWLLTEANRAVDPAAARVEAIKTGLGIGAGIGGVFALLLAVRRQWHQELSAADVALDAAEKRVTELYAKAADQLGSDKAPVRLAGLYALERLAQNNAGQRQTIVNVLCAYLRMPYDLPSDTPARDADQDGSEEIRDRVQEQQVRLTAQRILVDHVRPGPHPRRPVPTFWPDVDLDLTGATLTDLDLSDCRLRAARFDVARFTGQTRFVTADFSSPARFVGARFEGRSSFHGAHFSSQASFARAWFADEARFAFADFIGADFEGARFDGQAVFEWTRFRETGVFVDARFGGDVSFYKARFDHSGRFQRAEFAAGATFTDTEFDLPGEVWAHGAKFSRGVPEVVWSMLPPEETADQGESPSGNRA
ncbi:pentapeptide repeat-containing protein [Actinokineospora alba]|uniref:pentapeptide repeat-containing protein n=1 Tax=Actinokineospora alba TaxID=504798 RepID=UPI0015A33F44|nr:pentapeptide repeat-containing protein [Actinokineospora alba]